jgi:hypothetical protein
MKANFITVLIMIVFSIVLISAQNNPSEVDPGKRLQYCSSMCTNCNELAACVKKCSTGDKDLCKNIKNCC